MRASELTSPATASSSRSRAVTEHDGGEDRSRDTDAREDHREAEVGDADPPPLPPEGRRERHRDEQVRGRQHEQRNRVEVDSLVFVTHWALRMIGSASDPRPRKARKSTLFATWKDGSTGLLDSRAEAASVPVLGDASRGALYLALRPAASNGESPSPP